MITVSQILTPQGLLLWLCCVQKKYSSSGGRETWRLSTAEPPTSHPLICNDLLITHIDKDESISEGKTQPPACFLKSSPAVEKTSFSPFQDAPKKPPTLLSLPGEHQSRVPAPKSVAQSLKRPRLHRECNQGPGWSRQSGSTHTHYPQSIVIPAPEIQ
jgi:hypothetical protein